MPPQFPLDGWAQETLVGVGRSLLNKVCRLVLLLCPDQAELEVVQDGFLIDRQLNGQNVFLLAPVNGEHLVGIQVLYRTGKVVVLLIGLQLVLFLAILLQAGDQLAVVVGKVPQPSPDGYHLGDGLGQNFVGPGKGCLRTLNVIVDKFGCLSRQLAIRVGQQPVCQRCQSRCLGLLGLGLPFLFVGQVEILHRLEVGGNTDLLF